MLSNQAAKIQFLARMEKANCLMSELCAFLREEKLISPDTVKDILRYPPDAQAIEMYLLLVKLTDRFDLIDWEWVVLPKERMKLTIVTHNGVKEFSHEF